MEDDLDNYLNFYSVSGDGRLTNWCLVKSKIRYSDKYLINYSKPLTNISKENFASQLLGELIVSLLPATPTKLVSRQRQSYRLQARQLPHLPGGDRRGPDLPLHHSVRQLLLAVLPGSQHSRLQDPVEPIPALCLHILRC